MKELIEKVKEGNRKIDNELDQKSSKHPKIIVIKYQLQSKT